MRDLIGRTIGHYRIVDKIGAGGMGEVYRARDDRLDRDVAIKTILVPVALGEQRMARFEREAKLLASLSHQNIATIHGLEEHEGQHYLVMELAEGETLSWMIAKGPISIEDALDYARQIAEGLEAAHKQGIIHRDLKPANVMVSSDGKIKILDFGLAKGIEDPGSAPSTPDSIANSPTITAGVTATGVLLGTAAYMSPEQARGKQVDKRADVWAFGCVLYEMLTGSKAFEGDDASQTMAAILRDDPDWSALPSATPSHIRRLLGRCLAKKPRERLHDIADARITIQSPVGDVGLFAESTPSAPSRSRWPARVAWVLTASVPAIAVAVLFGVLNQHPAQPVTKAVIQLDPKKTLGSSLFGSTSFGQMALSRTAVALSPDGRFLVYSAGDRTSSNLYLRALRDETASLLEGTEGAWLPIISPDGEWIGFFAGDELGGALKRVRTRGGPVETICAVDVLPCSASWARDGSILFEQQLGGILQVDPAGGDPIVITTLEGDEIGHANPRLLDDGETLLFTSRPGNYRDWHNSRVVALSMRSGERSTLLNDASDAWYVSTGHLIFVRRGTLMAAPLDLDRRVLTGAAVVVQESVRHAVNTTSVNAATLSGQFSIAENGTLAHLSGGVWPDAQCQPVWMDRNGAEEPLDIPPGRYFGIRVSPDGQRVIVPWSQHDQSQLWVFDIARGTFSRLHLSDGYENNPIWTPDGERVAYLAGPTVAGSVYWTDSDGSGEAEQLTTLSGVPASWSPDGGSLVFMHFSDSTSWDLWLQPLQGEARPLIESPYFEIGATISPDGRWLAYESDYTGRREVYVTSFPDPGPRIQVSVEGGFMPAWASDGRGLFFRGPKLPNGHRPMMVADVSTGAEFSSGRIRELFSGKFFKGSPARAYDVAPDGQRLLMCKTLTSSEQRVGEIYLTLNWFTELERLVPTD
ncbi:MAG: protein kinase [Thermoanaerobaculales bacterium]|jgi:serine/threonine-protein kinase|nr:protein kinase [Thermoanaerobaculales bacterium]